MTKQTIDRRETSFFSEFANQINDNQEALGKYIQNPISIESFKHQIELKKKHFSKSQREITYNVLKNQLEKYSQYTKLQENVGLIKEDNTFTVTAGHQLNLYGGPLFTAYKIMDVVRLAEQLSAEYSEYNFVPVFWLATEDHDFAEINHIHLFHDTLAWESEQEGPVGRFSLDGFDKFKEELLAKFNNNPDYAKYLDSFYNEGTLTEASIEFLLDLFGDYGLVILDADNPKLKASFAPLMHREIETEFSEPKILETIKSLEEDGFHGQATPRPINLFYIKDQYRERIIPIENNQVEIGGKSYSKEEVLKELAEHPQRFSPNVVMRPLYQETILPNLCYLGGGGEMAYWLELKTAFEETDVPFPLIKVRNSVQWFDKNTLNRLEQLGLEIKDVFKSIHEVKKEYVFENAEEELDFTDLEATFEQFTAEIEKAIINVDKGLEGYGKSEITRVQRQLDTIKTKLVRHQKRKFDESMARIDGVYERLFPNSGLQERYENVIPYIDKFGKEEFVKMIYELTDPFETDLILAIED